LLENLRKRRGDSVKGGGITLVNATDVVFAKNFRKEFFWKKSKNVDVSKKGDVQHKLAFTILSRSTR